MDGPELSGDIVLPDQGTARYRGRAGGIYAQSYGSDTAYDGATEMGEYVGDLAMRADFVAGTLSGEINAGAFDGIFVFADGQTMPFSETNSDVRLILKTTRINADGSAAGETELIWPGLTITRQDGSWGNRLSSIKNTAGHPRGLAGTHGGSAVTSGGSEVVFVGAHAGVAF
ncbi:MAG: hypothetical protein OXC68_13935 [Aestuariivita sp.]|nr:hypothetical protein [Aestuariivita sp.]